MSTPLLITVLVLGLGLVLAAMVLSQYFTLWIQCKLSGAHIPFVHLVGAGLRRTDVRTLAFARIRLNKAGLDIPVQDLETHMLAGGDLPRTSSALILSHRHGLGMTWPELAALDLEGQDSFAKVKAIVGDDD